MSFFNESVQSANKFLKTICFIDDQPVFNKSEDPTSEDIDHRLYADVITKAFAPQGKTCSFYHYQKHGEEKDLLELANSSDINVLDWRILLDQNDKTTTEIKLDEGEISSGIAKAIPINNEEDEKDVEEKESRGKYALNIIEQILSRRFESPKLIIILTAEYDADSIFNPVREKLDKMGLQYSSSEDELWFQNDKFRISIYFKESLKIKHLSKNVKSKVIRSADLPAMTSHEFAFLIDGLVLKTAIDCISEVRANTFSLLGSYNKNLDPAFLTHKSLLPNSSDAEEHLVEIIGSDIKGILKSSGVLENLRESSFPKYIEEKFQKEEYLFDIPDADKFPSLKITNKVSNSTLKSIVNNGVEKTFFGKDQPHEEQIIFSKSCHRNLTKTFTPNDDAELAKKSDIQFAILTTIRPTYQIKKFILTQGTVVKEESSNNYWLCVQPKCDSVRIGTKKRAFLFLRLFKSDENNFNIVLNPDDPIFLKIDYRIYNTKSFDFFINEEGVVLTFLEGDVKKFKRWDNKNMVWVAELKNDFAQSISNTFSVELSRVGLDLSEWLRRCS